ncbi:(d)CMP kinase [Desulforhopalus sp. IMCC35007]|uniref:(d)CMP kinase n=1 Tax=Desulforhopalus sp. IMCC35007 TaxID=2569543 RepID=UPI0010AE7F27|nr:(d)CMP kinase [Desulforhopalus sp. IMCC35007]TKB11652.1 (d)CMP kinase [Desulforhopalus sp. IMCC35007]
MSDKQQIITIDGPAGVGKSTVSRMVAAATGFTYLDTGAMYRGVGLFLQEQGVDLTDSSAIKRLLATLDLQLLPAFDKNCDVGVLVNTRDVSDAIRTPEMAMVASNVSALPVVRDYLTTIQRNYGEKGGIVAEGRDMGTVVFPDAAYKFFLDAKAEERARRRFSQLKAKGVDADLNEILAMTRTRDKNDSERQIAPLMQAADAVRIDTTEISVDEVVSLILKKIKKER